MFSKKYVFETQETRFRRLFLNFSIFTFFFVLLIGTLFIFLPYHSKSLREASTQSLFDKAPDVIAVFTGDKGRISYALERAKKYPSSKVFITGVHATNSLKTLVINQLSEKAPVEEEVETKSQVVEIDYLARNTIENVISTLNFVRKNPHLDNILVISNDYHIFRIKLIFNTLQREDDKFRFHFEGIDTDYNQVRNVKILFKEVFKLIKAFLFLYMWDYEIQPVES